MPPNAATMAQWLVLLEIIICYRSLKVFAEDIAGSAAGLYLYLD